MTGIDVPRPDEPMRAAAPPPGVPTRGDVDDAEGPNWKPLLAVVGVLSSEFMWMFAVRLENGRAVHAYKHRSTRRYLHLGEDGDAYRFRHVPYPPELAGEWYHPIDRAVAIHDAFARWTDLLNAPELLSEYAAALHRALDHAARGELIPVDPAWLEAQREFEARSRGTESGADAST